MKINIHAGHTRQDGGSPGASGIVHESVENRRIVAELIRLLKGKGHTVYNTTDNLGKGMTDNLARIVSNCNAHTVDLDVSIHLNSSTTSKGDGTETYVYSTGSKAKPYADRINANIAKLGYRNRGVKTANFYVLRNTNAPALLVETFFCNSAKDAALYAKHGPDAIALAIANGIDTSVVGVGSANTVRYRTQGSVAICDSRGNVVGWTKRDQVLEGTMDGRWLRLAPGQYVDVSPSTGVLKMHQYRVIQQVYYRAKAGWAPPVGIAKIGTMFWAVPYSQWLRLGRGKYLPLTQGGKATVKKLK